MKKKGKTTKEESITEEIASFRIKMRDKTRKEEENLLRKMQVNQKNENKRK